MTRRNLLSLFQLPLAACVIRDNGEAIITGLPTTPRKIPYIRLPPMYTSLDRETAMRCMERIVRNEKVGIVLSPGAEVGWRDIATPLPPELPKLRKIDRWVGDHWVRTPPEQIRRGMIFRFVSPDPDEPCIYRRALRALEAPVPTSMIPGNYSFNCEAVPDPEEAAVLDACRLPLERSE